MSKSLNKTAEQKSSRCACRCEANDRSPANGRLLAEQLSGMRQKRLLYLSLIAPNGSVAHHHRQFGKGRHDGKSTALTRRARAEGAETSTGTCELRGKGDRVDRESRFTPPDFMASIYEAFGAVDLVPCADVISLVIAERRIMPSADGNSSTDQWSGRLIFMNPPYSEQLKSLRRAYEQWTAAAVGALLSITCRFYGSTRCLARSSSYPTSYVVSKDRQDALMSQLVVG